jgi:hypothetical protein
VALGGAGGAMLRRISNLLARSALAAALLGAGLGNAQVSMREGAYDWKTWDVSERADHGVNGQSLARTVTRHYKTLILENEYLTVTLLPDYGARILSILYKPTGHEQLFQNPVGFADGIGAGSFYYNWLMVLGGIFPTFPEPEHGKTYLLPWKSETTVNRPDRISVAMTLQDNIDFSGHPGRFAYGVTGLTCTATVTLDAGKAAVEMNVRLRNDRAQPVRYEYWTCHALAPGSVPGDTKAPRSTEIVAPIDRYSIGYGTGVTDRNLGNGFEYKNLAFFRNWTQEGIAYAEPAVTKPWWGVLNHDNEEGIFRVVDDPAQTPGMKFWTWGYRNSYPLDARERQFIELWAGASHQFFTPATLAANASKSWTETYIPTVGLKGVSLANEKALVSLRTDKAAYDGSTDKTFTFYADVVSATPGTALRAMVTGGADGSRVLLDTTFKPDPKEAAHLAVTRPLGAIGPGKQTLTLKLLDPQGAVILQAGAPITVANATLSARRGPRPGGEEFIVLAMTGGGARLRFADEGARDIAVFDAFGRLRWQRKGVLGHECPMPADALGTPAGIVWVRIERNGTETLRRLMPPQ